MRRTKEKPFECTPDDVSPITTVARLDIAPRQQLRARHRPDGKSGKIVVTALIDAGHFRGLAADQSTACLPARGGDARDHHRPDLRIELAAGKIVEEEQRLGPLHHQVVHRHRHEVDADRVVTRGLDCDLDLGADAIGRRDQNGIGVAGGLEIEQAAEAADFGVCARPSGPPHQRLDQIDHAVAGIDIDAGSRVACLVHGTTNRHDAYPGGEALRGASYVGIDGCASARAQLYSEAPGRRAKPVIRSSV